MPRGLNKAFDQAISGTSVPIDFGIDACRSNALSSKFRRYFAYVTAGRQNLDVSEDQPSRYSGLLEKCLSIEPLYVEFALCSGSADNTGDRHSQCTFFVMSMKLNFMHVFFV